MTSPLPPSRPTVSLVVPIEQVAHGEAPLVRLRPGRCRRADRRPTLSQVAYETELSARAALMIAGDATVAATSTNSGLGIIDQTMRAIAQESAALLWDREHAIGRAGVEKLSSRRVAALTRLGELAVIRAELDAASLEPDPEDAARVVGLLMAEVEKIVHEVAEPAMAVRFLASLRAQMAAAEFPACCTRREGPP